MMYEAIDPLLGSSLHCYRGHYREATLGDLRSSTELENIAESAKLAGNKTTEMHVDRLAPEFVHATTTLLEINGGPRLLVQD
jgi:hypothetical protein